MTDKSKASASNLHSNDDASVTKPETSDVVIKSVANDHKLTAPEDVEGGSTTTVEASTETSLVTAADLDDEEELDVQSIDEIDAADEESTEEVVVEDTDDTVSDEEAEAEEEGDELYADDLNSILDDDGDDNDDEVSDLSEVFDLPEGEDLDDEEEEVVDAELVEDGTGLEVDQGTDDGVPLVDLDGVDDLVTDEENLAFASVGNNLHVLRANRIIATMTRGLAIRAGVEEIYHSENYAEVVIAEMQVRGLRKGLTQAGFVLAKVKVDSQDTIKMAVKQQVNASVSKMRVETAKRMDCLQQSLAIASVGIERSFFKGRTNPIREALEVELVAAGVRNARRIVRDVFATHGIAYSQQLIATASALADAPEATRDQMADALDLVAPMDAAEDDELFEDINNEVDDLVEDDNLEPMSLSASLRNPIRTTSKAALLHASTNRSAVEEVLDGTRPCSSFLQF